MAYQTLDGALAEVADRSFDESCTVSRSDAGVWEVADDYATCIPDDGVMWTYAGGLEWAGARVSEDSGLMESCELFATAAHIRHNFPDSVAALEAGHTVAFAYCTVHCWPETPEDIADADAGIYDDLIGWTLAARILPLEVTA